MKPLKINLFVTLCFSFMNQGLLANIWPKTNYVAVFENRLTTINSEPTAFIGGSWSRVGDNGLGLGLFFYGMAQEVKGLSTTGTKSSTNAMFYGLHFESPLFGDFYGSLNFGRGFAAYDQEVPVSETDTSLKSDRVKIDAGVMEIGAEWRYTNFGQLIFSPGLFVRVVNAEDTNDATGASNGESTKLGGVGLSFNLRKTIL